MSWIRYAATFVRGGLNAIIGDDARKQEPTLVVLDPNAMGRPNYYPAGIPMPQTNVYSPRHNVLPQITPTAFEVTFEPADEVTGDMLSADLPVAVLLADPDEPDEIVQAVTELGQGIAEGALYPGVYELLALVASPDDPDLIVGIGHGAFSIEIGEPPFDLHVPISADPEIIADVLGLDTVVVGNRRSHTYHLPECSGAERLSDTNFILFADPEAAEGEGYRPCGQCIGR